MSIDIEFLFGIKKKRLNDGKNLSRNFSQGERVHSIEGISPCLSSQMGGTANGSVLIMDKKILKVYDKSTTGKKSQSAQVYHTNGIMSAINAGTHGYSMGQIVTTVAYSKSTRENHIDVRGKVNGEANTISTGDGGGNMSTQNFVCSSDLRIRRLTPVECERLQGYPDNWTKFGRKPDGTVYEMSNTQRYKQCGNGITSPVSSAILQHLIPEGEVRLMSLFSGIGGTELLLPKRFKVVGHCEFDKHASAVLNYHYPNIPNFEDVAKFADIPNVPEFDLLTFGHPCQSFSAAGLRKGFADYRGQLIYEVFRIIDKYKPKYLLGENVKGLLTHDKGSTFEQIMVALSDLGYEVDFELVNSKNFGLAQNRERVFYFGRRKD